METPSSTRRMTRSQTKAAFSNTNNISSKETEKSGAKKSKQRTCLFDITNDSPIVGLASGNLSETPVSSTARQKRSKFWNKTPNSGEALLRSQVKNLLQKVEEEAVISNFLCFKNNVVTKNIVAAPTPANTPQVLNFNGFGSLGSVLESPIEGQITVSEAVSGKSDVNKQPEIEVKDIISRSLFQDFSDKSDSKKEEDDDEEEDDASIWSIQVNASIQDEEENKNENELIQDYLCNEDEEAEEVELKYDVVEMDQLCEEMKNVSVKHIRFVYNSDDEFVEEEVLHLKGIPTPKGKHLRFQDDEDDE